MCITPKQYDKEQKRRVALFKKICPQITLDIKQISQAPQQLHKIQKLLKQE